MRNNTLKIYEVLGHGGFLAVDSIDTSIRHLYEDIEDNFDDYADYFKEIGLQLESGDGYFYFSRIGVGKQSIEQKLESFSKWLDYVDFLECYDKKFNAGYQNSKWHFVGQFSLNINLKEKAGRLFKNYGACSNLEIVNKLFLEMKGMGFVEFVNEQDGTYKVTSAYRYVLELVKLILMANEDEIPE